MRLSFRPSSRSSYGNAHSEPLLLRCKFTIRETIGTLYLTFDTRNRDIDYRPWIKSWPCVILSNPTIERV
jgi:hypothetical protein